MFLEPFSHYVNNSGIGIAFFGAYAGLLMLFSVQFVRNYIPSKNIYALFAMPVRRAYVYLAKLAAAGLAGLTLLVAQLVLILLIFAQFQIFGRNLGTRNATLVSFSVGSGFFSSGVSARLFVVGICVT